MPLPASRGSLRAFVLVKRLPSSPAPCPRGFVLKTGFRPPAATDAGAASQPVAGRRRRRRKCLHRVFAHEGASPAAGATGSESQDGERDELESACRWYQHVLRVDRIKSNR